MEYSGGGRGLGTLAKGEVVLLDFPFTDLHTCKRRPALVLHSSGTDVMLAPITTSERYGVALSQNDLVDGVLRESTIRVDHLFTAHRILILQRVGILRQYKIEETIDAICSMLRS